MGSHREWKKDSSSLQLLENDGDHEAAHSGFERRHIHGEAGELHERSAHCNQQVQQSQSWFYQTLSARRPCAHAFPWLCEGPLTGREKKSVALVTFRHYLLRQRQNELAVSYANDCNNYNLSGSAPIKKLSCTSTTLLCK